MSVIELMWQVRGHITFYKQEVLWNLEKVGLEAVDRDLATPQGYPITQPTPIDVRGRRTDSVGTPRAHNTTLFPPAEKALQVILSLTAVYVGHTPPGPVDIPLGRGAMPILAKPEVETSQGALTSQATSSIRTMAPIAPIAGSVVELTSPPITCDQTEDERWYVLIISTEVKSGGNRGHSWGNHDCLNGGTSFQEPQYSCSSSRPWGKEGDGTPKHPGEEPGGRLTMEDVMDPLRIEENKDHL